MVGLAFFVLSFCPPARVCSFVWYEGVVLVSNAWDLYQFTVHVTRPIHT